MCSSYVSFIGKHVLCMYCMYVCSLTPHAWSELSPENFSSVLF